LPVISDDEVLALELNRTGSHEADRSWSGAHWDARHGSMW